MFEAFWQGRLIPGARIDSLPFIEVSYLLDWRQDCVTGIIYHCAQAKWVQHDPHVQTKCVQVTVCTTHMDVIHWMNLVLLGY